jgi:hypothetical protein
MQESVNNYQLSVRAESRIILNLKKFSIQFREKRNHAN